MAQTNIPILDLEPGLSVRARGVAPARRQPHDTVEGCRALAAGSLARADGEDTAHGRVKLEQSAASWNARADLLERVETAHQARVAAGSA